MRDTEYDHFGPWILEITDEDRIPKVFEPFVSDIAGALLMLKVPVNEERRNLKPGDHMYDYLVCLYEDRMQILVRREDTADFHQLEYPDISALRHYEDLLDGHFVMYGPERAYDLPYSTVSTDLVMRMVAIIRDRYTAEPSGRARTGSVEYRPDPDGLSYLFSGLLGSRDAEGKAGRLFALQTEQRMREEDRGFFRRLLYGAVDKRLLESLHFINDREIEIITRGREFAYRWQTVYGREKVYIPLVRLTDIHDEPDVRGVTSELMLDTAVSEYRVRFLAGNPALEDYRTIVMG